MSDSLGHRPWMNAPEVVEVFDALEAVGGPGCARFVGGCVRNALLNQPINDIDIATTLTPVQVSQALARAGIKAVPTGIDHGTITAVVNKTPLEITTLRRDVSTDGRRAVVAFTTDWTEDAQRRDFTLNALYCDRTGTLFDPTGQGIADAKSGRIVFVGDADARVAEDSLRILRFFRFLAWYGAGSVDQTALTACTAARATISNLPAERTTAEMLKLLAADDPRSAVALMCDAGILPFILPSTKDIATFNALVAIENDMLFETDATLRLASLIPDDQVAAAKACETLRLSNETRERLINSTGKSPRITSWMSPRETRRAVYRIGVEAFLDRVKLAWARSTRTATTHQWRGLLALGSSWSPPPFPITGDEVLQSGVPKGPMVGQVLAEIEDWWIDHDFIDDKFSAIEKLKAVAQGMAY